MIDLAICCCVVVLFFFTWRMTKPYDIARLMSYVWCPSLLMVHIVIGIPGGLSGYAFLYVSVLILFNVLGARIASVFDANPEEFGDDVPLSGYYKVQAIFVTLLVTCGIGIFGVFQLMWRNGFHVYDFFSFDRLRRMSGYLYVHLAEGEDRGTPIPLIAIYLSPLLGGFIFHGHRRRVLAAVLSFVPALLLMLVANTKSVLIFALTLFIASYVSSSLVCNRKLKLTRRNLLKVALLGLSVALLFGFSFALRYGRQSDNLQGEGAVRLTVNYQIAHAACFDAFLADGDLRYENFGYGSKTFLGPSSALGIQPRHTGIYTEWKYFSNRGGGLEFGSNVYSAFRPLVEDFTVLGSLLVAFSVSLFASIAGRCLHRMGWRIMRSFGVVVYTALLQYALYSFIASPWSYNSVIAALLLFGVILLLFGRRKVERVCGCASC